MTKPILYIDMDNTLVDFSSGIDRLSSAKLEKYAGSYDDAPGIFGLMRPMPDAVKAIHRLSKRFEVYILSTAPWDNPSAWQQKVEWVRDTFGADDDSPVYKRLILSHHKQLNMGDFLVDDRGERGAREFSGERIWFSSSSFPDWWHVVRYLERRVEGGRRRSYAPPPDIPRTSRRFYRLPGSNGDANVVHVAVTLGSHRHFFEWGSDGRWKPLTAAAFARQRDASPVPLNAFVPDDGSELLAEVPYPPVEPTCKGMGDGWTVVDEAAV
ncbi:hypothetical protein ACFFGH_28325 [Lysobacter korlensis]|uniref:Uncharacterized protein n=1 Tax=Lysobacter korlensis TaxID=553636 RepID=A0ABV6RXP4_9GAMM